MNWFEIIRSAVVARGHGLLRLRRVTKPTRLDCLGERCGLCCKVFGRAIAVDRGEAVRLVQIHAAVERAETTTLKHKGASCSLLTNNLCSIYLDRPRACREYPWYLLNGRLYYDAGCPGMRFDYGELPDPISLRPFDWYLDRMPAALQRLLTLIVKIW